MNKTITEANIPEGKRCPPYGKNKCKYRGYRPSQLRLPSEIPWCLKYNEMLVQGKTKSQQTKCPQCLKNEK